MNLNSYHTKIVGTTFEGRQSIINLMEIDTELRFRREPDNQYDSNAVAVDALVMHVADKPEWLPIGYIAKDKNSELAEVLTNGKYASIKLSQVTGGGDKSYGVNVYIEHEREVRKTRSENSVLVKDFFGNEIFYDPIAHEYTNSLGEVYLSGSAYAGEDNFDGNYWAEYAVKQYKLDPTSKQAIVDMWECNSHTSRAFGTAIHSAIELYGSYRAIADIIDIDLKTGNRKKDKNNSKLDKNSALSKLPYLRKVTTKFFTKTRLKEVAYYEVLVIDHKNKRAGRIDRLLLLPDGSYAVRDLKTNGKIGTPEKREQTKQLSFYADLLLANGCKLSDNPIMVHHWNENTWKDIKLDKIDTFAEPIIEDIPTPLISQGKSLSQQ